MKNAGGKNDRRSLQALAKEYLALICKDGLEKKSAFGAFYFKYEKAYKQRLGLELTLITLSSTDKAENRLKLRNAVLENGVKPYIQTMLKEKYGDGVDVATLDKCCDLINPRAREALDKIDEESEGYVGKNGASVRSVGRSLELIALWPELLRKIVDETHPSAAAMPPPSASQSVPEQDALPGPGPGTDEPDSGASGRGKPAMIFNGPVTFNIDDHSNHHNVINGGDRFGMETGAQDSDGDSSSGRGGAAGGGFDADGVIFDDRGGPGVDEVDAMPPQSVKPAAFIPIELNVKRGVLPRAEGAPSIEPVELGCAYRDGWGKFSDSDGKPVWRKATIDKDNKTIREDVGPDGYVELTRNRRLEGRTAPITILAPPVYRQLF